MLTLFRNMLRSKLALVLIGLLILSLAVWGITDIFRPGLGASLVKAGERTVEVEDVERFANNFVQSQRQQGNDTSKQELAENGQLDQIINMLAERELTAAYFDKLGVTASRKEATDFVRSMEAAQNSVTGRFDVEQFRQLIARQNYSEAEFEKAILDDMTFDLVQTGLTAGLQPPSGAIDLLNVYQAEARNIAYFTLDPSDLPEEIEPVSDDELQEFYEESQSLLTEPERRQFSIIAVREEDFYHRVTIDEDDLRNEYEAQQRRFSAPAERKFQIVRFADQAQASSVVGRLLGGADLEDVVSGNMNGVQIEPSRTVLRSELQDQAIANAVFNSPTEIWSGPVETLNGQWALVYVEEELPGEAIPFQEVEEEIREELVASRASRMLERSFDDIDDAIGAGYTLEEMADMIGSPVMTYPAIDRRGRTEDGLAITNIMSLEGALEYGFQLFANETSSRQDAGSVQYIMRLDDIVDPKVPELDTIREQLRTVLTTRRVEAAMDELAESIVTRINDGSSSITVEAQALGEAVQRPPQALSRQTGQASGFPQNVLGSVFTASLDEAVSAQLRGGRFVGVVESIRTPGEEELARMRASTRTTLESMLTNDFLEGLATRAEQTVKFEANPQQIDTYMSGYQVDE